MVPSTRSRARRFLPAALVAGLLVVATACIPPDSLQVTTAVSNLSQPWDIAFTPDGTMLYTEKPGRIDAFIGGSTRVLPPMKASMRPGFSV